MTSKVEKIIAKLNGVRKTETLLKTNKVYQGCRHCESMEPVTKDTEAESLNLCDMCYTQLKEQGKLANWGGKEI